MISSTTLLLATLVFNAATGFGAPIRIPTVPDVVARAVVDDPILPRVEVIDVQPVRKRSAEGSANRPRLAREIAPEVDTRDTASSESVSVRDSLPEIEEIVRRFPRRALYDRHVEKRSPEPTPNPPSDPAVETRSTVPEPVRRFARRALYDRHAQRSEPSPPEARSENPDPHFIRRDNPELFEKRSASITDNFPREPEPAPVPEPVPEPAPVPQSPPEPEVKAREPEPERRRAYPRRALAERYEKREEPPTEADPPASTAPPEATPSPVTPTPSIPTASPTVSASGLPANLDFNKVIADAIVSGTTNTVKHTQGQKVADWRDTKITIQITQQQNSDVKLEQPIPTPSSPPTSTSDPSPTPTGTSTGTSSPSPSPSPTGTGSSSSPEGSGSGGPTDSSTPKEGGATTDDPVTKPAVPPAEGPAGSADGGADSSSGSPDGEKAADAPADKRDLDNANAAAEPVTKRQLGLAGSLLASWTRRNV